MKRDELTLKVNGKAVENSGVLAASLLAMMKPANVATDSAIAASEAFVGNIEKIKAGNMADKFEVHTPEDESPYQATREGLVAWIEGAMACKAIRDSLVNAITRPTTRTPKGSVELVF